MKLLVWGAGAIGGTIGAYAARAGHAVVVVDAAHDHVDAIRSDGLKIEGPIETFTTRLPAHLPEALEGRFEHVLLAVKAHATGPALDQLEPHLAPDGYVVSLQNGLNEHLIAARIGAERTVGAFVNFGADVVGPGRIHFAGRGAFVLGELDGRRSDRVLALADALRSFDPGLEVSDSVWGYLWGKMGYAAMLSAGALSNASIAESLEAEDARPIFTALAGEVLRIARAEGVTAMGFNGFDPVAFGPHGDDAARRASFDAMADHNRRSAKTHSGVWRDLAVRKRRTEVSAQFDPIFEAASRHGIDLPVTSHMATLMEDVENGRRQQSWSTLLALRDVPAEASPGSGDLRA